MSIDFLGFQGALFFETQLPVRGFFVLGTYLLLTVAFLFYARRVFGNDFLAIKNSRHAALFVANLVLAPLLAQVLLVQVDPFGFEPLHGPSVALLGGLPLLVTAAWLGPGPAIVVGLASGVARAGWGTGRLAQAFEIALWAGVMGVLLRQSYRGRVGSWFWTFPCS